MADVAEGASPLYYGVIKSYNERRGFGFVACEETARRFGRDVYLSKEEATVLSKEPVLGSASAAAAEAPAAAADGSNQLPLKEGDFVQFQVQRSTEGYPQAVNARRVRRLRGVVVRGTMPRDGGEGRIEVKGEGREAEAGAAVDAELQRLLGMEVRVRQADCGQLWLVPGDEVIFCCTNASSASGADPRAPPQLEAQLVELLWTRRTAGSVLGCFTLELPRIQESAERAADAPPEQDPSAQGSELPAAVSVLLDGHALVDRVVLSGLPPDMEAPELMRLFSKLGASDATVMCPEADPLDVRSFVSISFRDTIDIARMLVRAAHTINEQGSTQLARLGPHREGVVALPAVSRPTIAPAERGALLVEWTQVGIAAGYLVELRPHGVNAPWASVGVASGRLEDASPSLPEGLLGPQCAACRVNGLAAGRLYETRVTYYTTWGCRSQASATSTPCAVAPTTPPGATGSAAVSTTAPPAPAAPVNPPAAPLNAVPPTGAFGALGAPAAPFAASAPAAAGQLPPPGAAAVSPPMAGSQPQPVLPGSTPNALSTGGGWRCVHGSIVPPPAAPELVPYEEVTRSVCIQWPTVVHATAYTVELLEEGTTVAERFTRAVPEILPEALVELRVGNLNPGAYAACVRCVAPCGCESTPSEWSFMPPMWLPTGPQPQLGGMGTWQSQALLATNPTSQAGILPPATASPAPHPFADPAVAAAWPPAAAAAPPAASPAPAPVPPPAAATAAVPPPVPPPPPPPSAATIGAGASEETALVLD